MKKENKSIEKSNRKDELSSKQIKFCEYYATGLNGAESARLSGYAKDSAKTSAYRLLKNEKIKQKIKELKSEILDELNVSPAYILNKLKNLAEANINDYYEKDSEGKLKLKDITKLPKALTERIQSITPTANGCYKLQLYNKKEVLVDLAKIQGMYKENAGMTNNQYNTVFVVPSFRKGKEVRVEIPAKYNVVKNSEDTEDKDKI